MSSGLSSIDQIDLLSVGIDIGSSTSHLVFSNLVLRRNEKTSSQRFEVVEREILYEGRIINTPLLDETTIDVEALVEFLRDEYDRAGIATNNIETGAVIVTGETAKKENAKEIVEKLSEDAGKFVAATAGPNFESLIAALGSGMAQRSKELNNTILSIDIGGGTSNMAISKNGEVISTGCVSVGGRLLAINENLEITRIDEPARKVMKYLGMPNYKIGDILSYEQINKIAYTFAEVLVEVCTGPTQTTIAKELLMTSDLDFSSKIDEVSFSGGVAELIYAKEKAFHNDIGQYLSDAINEIKERFNGVIVEPKNKIRATVIGAGAYSLSISGSTCFLDPSLDFPIKNVPIVRVDVDRNKLSTDHVIEEVNNTFQRFDITEGEEIVALYFKDPVRASYARLKLFAKSIEYALPNSLSRQIPIILIFERDIANSVGNIIRRETNIKENLLTLDELYLQEGDWIDIGSPLVNGQVFPVTVKSLIFNKKE